MSVATRIKAFFTSFTIKLFIWFWLVAIISIVSTRFISQQLSSERFSKAVRQAVTPEENQQLNNIARRSVRHDTNNIIELKKRFNQTPWNLWFKATNNGDSVQSLFPLTNNKQQKAVSAFISKQKFTLPKTYLFTHTRLIGPVTVKINEKSYQLLISRKYNKRNFIQMVESMPSWARIGIPVLTSFALCLLLAHSFSRPVRLIKRASMKLGQGEFATRVKGLSQRSDELGQLANSFNVMAEQLQQHQCAQKRLLGDVSHELRSPLTRLQMALGLAQQEVTTEQAREQYLHRCQREIDRLDKMLADVLSLSSLENTLQTINTEKISLNSLINTIVSDEQFIADEKAIKIIANDTDEIFINGDRALLTSAISNVLSNAVKYSPENSTINVNLTKKHQCLYLTIQDEGYGVPEQALSHLFSPFYRVNLARDRKTGGTGLGLAIAKQAILAHQGKITAKNRAENTQKLDGKNANSMTGLSVTIELPCL